MNDSSEKAMGVLSYIPFLCLIPIITGSSQFVRYHANQGLVLFITDLILGAIIGICGAVISIVPFIGPLVAGLASGVFGLIILAFVICGIVHAVNSEMKPLPIIGQITILK